MGDLKSLQELILDGNRAKELRNIELGDYIILINTINEIKINLIFETYYINDTYGRKKERRTIIRNYSF